MNRNPLCKNIFRGNLDAPDFEPFYHWINSFRSKLALPGRRSGGRPWHADPGGSIILAGRSSNSLRLHRGHSRRRSLRESALGNCGVYCNFLHPRHHPKHSQRDPKRIRRHRFLAKSSTFACLFYACLRQPFNQ